MNEAENTIFASATLRIGFGTMSSSSSDGKFMEFDDLLSQLE